MSKKKTLAPSVTARDPKGLKFVSIVEAAYNKAGLSEEEAQRVNDTPGLADLIGHFIAENRHPDQFADEEEPSSYGYLSGYRAPKPMAEQVRVLKGFLPELGTFDKGVGAGELPAGAEGLFVIPRWEAVAPTYGEAVQKILDCLKKARGGRFHNFRAGKLGPENLRQQPRTSEKLAALAEEQPGHDILAVPAQFGIRHRGRSVRRARVVFAASEFGLGSFAVGCMLLTHPERLQHLNDLWVDCAGDEYDPGADGQFGCAPCFHFRVGELGFDAVRVNGADACYGSVSAFSRS